MTGEGDGAAGPGRRRRPSRRPFLARRFAAALAALLLAALALSACSKPDASYSTSPSALALLGSSEGDVVYAPSEEPPPPMPDPPGWSFDLGNARFEELENFDASIQVVALLDSEPAERMEIWLLGDDGPVMRWSGGPTESYNGTLCFQIALEEEGMAVPVTGGGEYELRIAFFDDAGETVASRAVRVAGRAPDLDGDLPDADAIAGRVLLACPRAPL